MIRQIGKYRILERIGRGGMGSVFKAHDPVLDRLVALKVFSAEADYSDELRARFFREAQACAKLSHHNIVTIHDLGEADGNLFIVMELLEGEELRKLIAQRTLVHLEDKLPLMVQICEGLGYAHERGIVHRDVKPGNIFVLRNGQVKILDFGIARIEAAETGLTRTGLIIGTLQYMAPERARGHGDHRSDIFSVGAVFYELLTYRPPFVGDDPMEILEKLRTEDPPRLDEVDPTLPPELGAIVERALQKDPSRRFAALGQMAAELSLVRRRVAEDVDRLRGEVQIRLRQLRGLREALATRAGGAWADETELVMNERAPLATLETVDRDTTARIQRLRGLLTRVESLQPALDRGLEALRQGEPDKAVSELEHVVRAMPEHVRAAESLKEAQRQADEQRLRREQAVAEEPQHPLALAHFPLSQGTAVAIGTARWLREIRSRIRPSVRALRHLALASAHSSFSQGAVIAIRAVHWLREGRSRLQPSARALRHIARKGHEAQGRAPLRRAHRIAAARVQGAHLAPARGAGVQRRE